MATTAVRNDLRLLFAASKHFPESVVAGPLPHGLFYGYVPSTETYWALARFTLTSSASFQDQVDMQDGTDTAAFSRPQGGRWKFVGFPGVPFRCQGLLPQAVLSVWDMTGPGGCGLVLGA